MTFPEQNQKPAAPKEKEVDKHWRDDFSVDWDATDYVSRREFTRFMALSSAGMAVGTTMIAVAGSLPKTAEAAEPLLLGKVSQFEVGSSTAFEYPKKGRYALLLRHEDGNFSAFSQKCPHLGCAVYHAKEKDVLECPCHEGFFNPKTGDVIAGPPQRGLAVVDLEIRGDEVWAVGGGGH